MFRYPFVKNISRRSYAQNVKKMMKIYTKRFLYFTSTYNYILYKIQIFTKIRFFKIKWICKITRLLRSIVHTQSLAHTNFISFVSEKDFRVSYFDKKKKLSCILWAKKLIWRWIKKKKKKKKNKKKAFLFSFFFPRVIKKAW